MNRQQISQRRKEAMELYRQGVPQTQIAKRLQVHKSTLKRWIALIVRGHDGVLSGASVYTTYPIELKLQAVRMHLEEKACYADIAVKLGIQSSRIIRNWCRQYKDNHGEIPTKRKGRKSMNPQTQSPDERIREMEVAL